VGHPETGVQQAEVVVYLRHRSHCGTRVVRPLALLDGDGRGQALDVLDVRFLHEAEELAGVRRQALHVPPLALRVDGVEREGRLARTGNPRDHGERVAGDLDVDVLEIVLAGTLDEDTVPGVHGKRPTGYRVEECTVIVTDLI